MRSISHGRAIDEPAHHLRFRLQFDQRPLDRLVARERLAERLARVGVVDAFVDAILRDADADAAWRMRFSCTKWRASTSRCRRARTPPPPAPRLLERRAAWSVGMLNVHIYSSIFTPSASIGTMRQVSPRASPSAPLVRTKTMSCVATCTPVFHIFSPLMRQPLPSLTARVSIQVASEPCLGSVRPNAMRVLPASMPAR